MFNPNNLTDNDKKILAGFYNKRAIFDKYILLNKLQLFTCPGCGYPTLSDRGHFEICSVCNWEDDYRNESHPDDILGGPNGHLSLTENRINIGRILQVHAESLNGIVSHDSVYVINAIEFYDKKQSEVESRMSGDETLDHPIWVEWRQVGKDLQAALCQKQS